MAACTALSKPQRCNVSTPSMVVPPGVVTESIRAYGCMPLSLTSFALPITALQFGTVSLAAPVVNVLSLIHI